MDAICGEGKGSHAEVRSHVQAAQDVVAWIGDQDSPWLAASHPVWNEHGR